MKNVYFIILSIVVIAYILESVRRNKLSIKTSFRWIIASFIMLFLSIFPYSLDWFALQIGISYPPALFLTLAIVFLVIIVWSAPSFIQFIYWMYLKFPLIIIYFLKYI